MDNPCEICTIERHCCRNLHRLMLSEDEYKNHFEHQSESTFLERSGKFYMVSSKKGHACPHLDGGKCRIYTSRPIDCRLFPYIIRHVFEKRNGVKIIFHQRAKCPQKQALYSLMPETEARSLILSLAKKVYGEDEPIRIQKEQGELARVRNRAEAAIRGAL